MSATHPTIRTGPEVPPTSSRRGDRRGLGLTALAAVAFVCMSMPWVTVSCGGQTVLEQSGYQVMTGRGTVSADSGARARTEEEVHRRERDDEADAAWWLALVMASTVVAGAHGYRIARSGEGLAAASWVSTSGAVVLSLSLAVGLPAERIVDDLHDSVVTGHLRPDGAAVGAAIGSVIQTQRSAGPWLMLLTLWLQAGCAAYLHVGAAAPRAPARFDVSWR